jgi:hypothetical protein
MATATPSITSTFYLAKRRREKRFFSEYLQKLFSSTTYAPMTRI